MPKIPVPTPMSTPAHIAARVPAVISPVTERVSTWHAPIPVTLTAAGAAIPAPAVTRPGHAPTPGLREAPVRVVHGGQSRASTRVRVEREGQAGPPARTTFMSSRPSASARSWARTRSAVRGSAVVALPP